MENEELAVENPEPRKLTYGEMAVGLPFNPSDTDSVYYCKRDFARIIDHINEMRESTDVQEIKRMCSIAITELQTAQMWTVKAITWPY